MGEKLVTARRVSASATCEAVGSATAPAANSRNLLRESFILLLHKLEDRFVVSPRVPAAAYPHFLLRGWPAMPAAGPKRRFTATQRYVWSRGRSGLDVPAMRISGCDPKRAIFVNG